MSDIRYVGPIPGRRLIFDQENYGKGDFCCTEMNIHINEKEKIIKYYSPDKSYLIQIAGYTTQLIKFCPWCGTQLPEKLSKIRSEIVFEELNLESYDGTKIVMGKYDYLKKYIGAEHYGKPGNSFYSVSEKEIEEEEQRLEFKFPDQLREFWLEIGCGCLRTGAKGELNEYKQTNCILRPQSIADIILLDQDDENQPALPEFTNKYLEGYLTKYDIPFLEIGDSTSFLIMRTNSDKPNAVYSQDVIKRV